MLCLSAGGADLPEEMTRANAALDEAMPKAEALLLDGRLTEANDSLVSVFPEKSRTPAQALVLGNVLFKHDPKRSYALHQRAARELGQEPLALFEWALEQHRAGEYAGAGQTYAQLARANPERAVVHGLWAECLIRTGKTREAAEAWARSERATQGTVQELESLVCEVHDHSSPDEERARLMPLVARGEVEAAERLVALDGSFPRDWWNNGPQAEYLAQDLALLKKTRFRDEKRYREVLCAAEVCLARTKENNQAPAPLRRAGLLLGEGGALPASDKLLPLLLAAALETKALTVEEARAKWGATLVQRAKASRDAEAWNTAAHLYLETEKLGEIDRLAWEATGDARFAASFLVSRAAKKALTIDDPALVKALGQFPENAEIARIAVALSQEAKRPMAPVLVRAVKAEYTHFSVSGELFPRPSAAALRGYFQRLSRELVAEGRGR
jgi:hypothetical protein